LRVLFSLRSIRVIKSTETARFMDIIKVRKTMSLALKYDLCGVVVEADETHVRYTLTFNSLELGGGDAYSLLIRSESSKIVIMVIGYGKTSFSRKCFC